MICGVWVACRFDDFKVWKGGCDEPDGSTERSPAAQSLPPTPNNSNTQGVPESSSLAAGHGENFTAQNCMPPPTQAESSIAILPNFEGAGFLIIVTRPLSLAEP